MGLPDFTSPTRVDLMVYDDATVQKIVYANGKLELITDTPNPSVPRKLYAHLDSQGGTIQYTKDNGKSFAAMDFSPWGMVDPSKLENNNNGLFMTADYTGYTYDVVLDIYFAQARMYDPDNKRFLAVDPVKGSQRNPITFNAYVYCQDNPASFVDPLGEDVIYGTNPVEKIRTAMQKITDTAICANQTYYNLRDLYEKIGGIVYVDSAANIIGTRVTYKDDNFKFYYKIPTSYRDSWIITSATTYSYKTGGKSVFQGYLKLLYHSYKSYVNGPELLNYFDNVFCNSDYAPTQFVETQPIKVEKHGINSSNKYLTLEQMQVNARYIYDYLSTAGWSKNAVCALLGNMQTESTINPGIWQNFKKDNMNVGFGLVQWTPASKYFDWAEKNGLDSYDIDTQLKRILYEASTGTQWQAFRHNANISFAEFTQSTKSPEELADIFLYCYERPSEKPQPKRGEQARYWFDFLY